MRRVGSLFPALVHFHARYPLSSKTVLYVKTYLRARFKYRRKRAKYQASRAAEVFFANCLRCFRPLDYLCKAANAKSSVSVSAELSDT
jgi:hypothetical protein